MAKYLIHLGFPSWVIDNMVMYDVAIKLQQAGNEVHLFYCDRTVPICFSNPTAEAAVCRWCRWYRGRMSKSLPTEISVHTFKEYYDVGLGKSIAELEFQYNSVQEIKKLTYKEVKIGYGALSTYISQTRNLNPELDASFKTFFDSYLRAECLLVEIFDRALQQIKPDCVATYNGRFFETRPIYDYAKSLGYQVRCYDNVRPLGLKKGISAVFFENTLPHNVDYNVALLEKNWAEPNLSQLEKRAIAESFFLRRRGGYIAGDVVYTAKQVKGLLPKNWDQAKRNIVIFNSSEDEFAAISDEHYEMSLFPNQLVGVQRILELYSDRPQVHFNLRLHPNLKNIRYKYHQDYYELEKQFKNLTIISPQSQVSSYALMDQAEKVIVFGSTIGVESAYWGKPVILLAESFYSSLDLFYKPKSGPELVFLLDADLKSKDNLPALKFGFYVMRYDGGDLVTNYDTGAIVIKKKYFFFKYRPIRYSTVYLAIIKIFLIIINKIYPRRKNKIPTKENK